MDNHNLVTRMTELLLVWNKGINSLCCTTICVVEVLWRGEMYPLSWNAPNIHKLDFNVMFVKKKLFPVWFFVLQSWSEVSVHKCPTRSLKKYTKFMEVYVFFIEVFLKISEIHKKTPVTEYLNKVKDSRTALFLWILLDFYKHLFSTTPVGGCFYLKKTPLMEHLFNKAAGLH